MSIQIEYFFSQNFKKQYPSLDFMLDRLKAFMNECVRVFKITQKPSKDELKVILKASALGMALIGIIGFIIQIAWILVF